MQKALGVEADGAFRPATGTALKGKAKDVIVDVQTELAAYGSGEDCAAPSQSR